MERQSVCICMATYNGIKHIKEQVNSILEQIHDGDEFLISDDGSTDGTLEYINELAIRNKNIRVLKGPQKGANANFFHLIAHASRDIVLISDQDDIWMPNKIVEVCKTFNENPDALVVLHEDTIKYVEKNKEVNCNILRHGIIKNFIRSSYSGHRMAFKKEFRNKILKRTEKCPSYDQYLGLLAEKYHCSVFLHEKLDIHMMHGSNVTHPLSLYNKVKLRLGLLRCLFSR